MKKVSDRALVVLMAIRERTGEDGSFWLPTMNLPYGDWVDELNYWVNVSGGGDAAILRSLEKAGLIERPRDGSATWKYAFRITEDGILTIEKARETGRLDHLKRR